MFHLWIATGWGRCRHKGMMNKSMMNGMKPCTSSSHDLQGFFCVPGGAGFLPSTVWEGWHQFGDARVVPFFSQVGVLESLTRVEQFINLWEFWIYMSFMDLWLIEGWWRMAIPCYSLFGHSLEICSNKGPEKIVVGRVLSFWDAPFSGAMLNFRGVVGNKRHK